MKRSLMSKLAESLLTTTGIVLIAYNAGFLVGLGIFLFVTGNNLKFTPRG